MQVTFSGSPTLDSIITVQQLKDFLRVDHTAEDDYITALRQAAISWVEEYCNIKLGDYTCTGYLDYFSNSTFPVGPVNTITAVGYTTTTAGAYTDLPADNYYYDTNSEPGRIVWNSPPALFSYALARVKITFTAGYAAAAVPEPITQAMRMLVGHWYEHRQSVHMGMIPRTVPLGTESLLSPYRFIQIV
tara:strand:- start:379 stop:945 length:567 start_codon:yes stop_codon:yes gene_type:complete